MDKILRPDMIDLNLVDVTIGMIGLYMHIKLFVVNAFTKVHNRSPEQHRIY